MNSIDDPNETAKKLAENTEAEHTGKPRAERDLLAEVEATDASVIAELPRAERAAHYREMMSSLRRAASAAKMLVDLPVPDASEEGLETEEEGEDEEGPTTEPHRPSGRSLALLSDGHVALSVAYLEGADLTGYQRWEGVILSPEQAEEALEGLSDAADDVAANIGGAIRWRKKKSEEPEGEGSDGQG
jgi:hypothetical protein